jgi:hypothetical protein
MNNDEDTADLGDDTDSFWNDDDGWDEDLDGPLERDPAIFAFAEKILPKTGEIARALELVTNLPIESLVMAGILEEHMRGNMPDAQVNSLVAAAILSGCANYEDICDEFAPRTRAAVDDFYTVLQTFDNGMVNMGIYADLSMDGQRSYIASVAADLELFEKEMTSGGSYPLPDAMEMRRMGEFLAAASRVPAEKPCRGDVQMMIRTMQAFNRLSDMMGLNVDLVLRSPDMTIAMRDRTRDAERGSMKPKFDSKSRKPQDWPEKKPPKKKKKDQNKKPPRDDNNPGDSWGGGPGNDWGDGPKTPDYFM